MSSIKKEAVEEGHAAWILKDGSVERSFEWLEMPEAVEETK